MSAEQDFSKPEHRNSMRTKIGVGAAVLATAGAAIVGLDPMIRHDVFGYSTHVLTNRLSGWDTNSQRLVQVVTADSIHDTATFRECQGDDFPMEPTIVPPKGYIQWTVDYSSLDIHSTYPVNDTPGEITNQIDAGVPSE